MYSRAKTKPPVVPMYVPISLHEDVDSQARRRSMRFLNWGHAIDHFVMLIFPTVVIGLETVYGRSYSEMIVLGTASFVAFGVCSLPAGWLADRWSRRNMMAVFYLGSGLSLMVAGLAPNLAILAIALFALGVFAAIYHPVGVPMLIEAAVVRGRALAFNGVCGNLGAALAAGITALLASVLGWRGAFIAPAAVCLVTGFLFVLLVPDDRRQTRQRASIPESRLSPSLAMAMFGLLAVASLTAGLTFNTLSVALPKIVDERAGGDISLMAVGGLATAVFLCGALAQFAVGRLVERFQPHTLFAAIVAVQVLGLTWAVFATGPALLAALALSMAAIYGQITVNDMVIARYTADSWRGRVYAVRFFLTFVTSGAAVAGIALLHGRGGFDLVLSAAAVTAAVMLASVAGIALIASGVERTRSLHLGRDGGRPAETKNPSAF